jgi:hypothetical protein
MILESLHSRGVRNDRYGTLGVFEVWCGAVISTDMTEIVAGCSYPPMTHIVVKTRQRAVEIELSSLNRNIITANLDCAARPMIALPWEIDLFIDVIQLSDQLQSKLLKRLICSVDDGRHLASAQEIRSRCVSRSMEPRSLVPWLDYWSKGLPVPMCCWV